MWGDCEDTRRQREMTIRRHKRLPATYKPYRLVKMSWLIKGKEILTPRTRQQIRCAPMLQYNEPLNRFIVKISINLISKEPLVSIMGGFMDPSLQ